MAVPKMDYTSAVWRRIRREVLRTRPAVCFCGEPIDLTLSATHPMSATVDHIVPVSQGGEPYARSNLRPAHRACNAGRRHHGDTAIREQQQAHLPTMPQAGEPAPWH